MPSFSFNLVINHRLVSRALLELMLLEGKSLIQQFQYQLLKELKKVVRLQIQRNYPQLNLLSSNLLQYMSRTLKCNSSIVGFNRINRLTHLYKQKNITKGNRDGCMPRKTQVLRDVMGYEIHHIGQLSIWARELNLQSVSANLIGRG